jgi:hypothetical protein
MAKSAISVRIVSVLYFVSNPSLSLAHRFDANAPSPITPCAGSIRGPAGGCHSAQEHLSRGVGGAGELCSVRVLGHQQCGARRGVVRGWRPYSAAAARNEQQAALRAVRGGQGGGQAERAAARPAGRAGKVDPRPAGGNPARDRHPRLSRKVARARPDPPRDDPDRHCRSQPRTARPQRAAGAKEGVQAVRVQVQGAARTAQPHCQRRVPAPAAARTGAVPGGTNEPRGGNDAQADPQNLLELHAVLPAASRRRESRRWRRRSGWPGRTSCSRGSTS